MGFPWASYGFLLLAFANGTYAKAIILVGSYGLLWAASGYSLLAFANEEDVKESILDLFILAPMGFLFFLWVPIACFC